MLTAHLLITAYSSTAPVLLEPGAVRRPGRPAAALSGSFLHALTLSLCLPYAGAELAVSRRGEHRVLAPPGAV